jgi:hypothetical protein
MLLSILQWTRQLPSASTPTSYPAQNISSAEVRNPSLDLYEQGAHRSFVVMEMRTINSIYGK